MKIVQPNKKFTNYFDIQGLTKGKLLALKRALELDQKETGSTLGGEMLNDINHFLDYELPKLTPSKADGTRF